VDPDFNTDQRAFYSVRVLEYPKPCWTAYDIKFFNTKMREGSTTVVQNRAYTSSKWHMA
jgi:hypothetical protein